jgi:CRISPR-associated protein Cas5d
VNGLGYGVKLLAQGEYACFTRPEMKAERVSYDVMTPSAARGVVEAVYWHPGIRWVIDRITVLNEIQFGSVRRNELGHKISYANVKQAVNGGRVDLHQRINEDRQQRATLLLKDVAYVIEAHFETGMSKAGSGDTPEKHYNMFLRRARKGQCFYQPYLGCREFSAHFKLLEEDEGIRGFYQEEDFRDLGWMLWDIVYQENPQSIEPRFFRASMRHGVIDVPKEVVV